MKAIIMAGGEGTRLLPISHGIPKPMTRIFDKPVMEHIIKLLKKHHFDDICVTLCSKPELIKSYFGDGSQFGVKIRYKIETQPLGTAGGVKNCSEFIGDDDCLIISGDAVCDFNLTDFVQRHKHKNPLVSIALTECANPLRYGLVVTDNQGAVRGFVEKPDWSRVVTNHVSTGIYMLSPKAVAMIPENTRFDFAKDLFPKILAQNLPINGRKMEGYWCDMGTPSEYRKCTFDALKNTLKLEINSKEISDGIFCSTLIDKSVILNPPCFIGENVIIGKNVEIGANSSINSGSVIADGAKIYRSIIDGGIVEKNAILDGAIVCNSAVVEENDISEIGQIYATKGAIHAPISMPPRIEPKVKGRIVSEIPCHDRALFMRKVSEAYMEAGADFSNGLLIVKDGAAVRVSPAHNKNSVFIHSASGFRNVGNLVSELEGLGLEN